MSFIAVGITLGAAALGAYAKNQAANKQDDALAAGIQHQSQYQNRIDDLIGQLLSGFGQSGPADERASLQGEFRQILADNRANTGLPVVGNTSDAYQQAATHALGAIHDYAGRRSNQLATADAYHLQRAHENQDMQRYLDQVRRIRANARDQAGSDQIAVQSIQPSPYLMALSQLGMGFGSMYSPGMGASGGDMAGANAAYKRANNAYANSIFGDG